MSKSMDKLAFYVGIGSIIILACWLRLPLLHVDILQSPLAPDRRTGYPLGDGGLFYQMIYDLQANSYRLPAYTSYNNGLIPFAYPPLAFYLLAGIQDVTNYPLVLIMRYYPFVVGLVVIPLIYTLANQLFNNRYTAWLCTILFTLYPPTSGWLIAGGGVTRATGLLFAVITLIFTNFYLSKASRLSAILIGLSLGLTGLSHPEWGVFTLTSCFLLIWHQRQRIRAGIALAGFSLALVLLPYFSTVVSSFGLRPFVAAISAGNLGSSILNILTYRYYNFTDEAMLGVYAVIGIVTWFIAISRRLYFLAIWVILIIIINSHNVSMFLSIPLVFLLSYILHAVLWPIILRLNQLHSEVSELSAISKYQIRLKRFGLLTSVTLLTGYLVYNIQQLPRVPFTPSRQITQNHVTAMEWIKENIPKASSFALLSSSRAWYVDEVAEWFPTIAQRRSVNTIQGLEWTSEKPFKAHVSHYYDLQNCQWMSVSCLLEWQQSTGYLFDYLYVYPEIASQIVPYLHTTYELVYFEDGVRIFKIPATESATAS